MLFDWYKMLKELLNSPVERDQQLATHLYQPIALAFENAVNDKEIF
jgi:hypothetical protein